MGFALAAAARFPSGRRVAVERSARPKGDLEVGRKSVDFASTRAENRRLVPGENSRLYGFFRSEPRMKEFS